MYHVFHSYDDVVAGQGTIQSVKYGSGTALRWKINNLDRVYFHQELDTDLLANVEFYCSKVMAASDSSHALICMGGDISTIFAIKSAIEKGMVIFVIDQTGKLSNCIALLRQMQHKSVPSSEILANLLIFLKRCTSYVNSSTDDDAPTDELWLHVRIVNHHVSAHVSLIPFLQLDGRQPELFFAGISEAIMFIVNCHALVHVLDIGDPSVSSQFSLRLRQPNPSDGDIGHFPFLLKRYPRRVVPTPVTCDSYLTHFCAVCFRRVLCSYSKY